MDGCLHGMNVKIYWDCIRWHLWYASENSLFFAMFLQAFLSVLSFHSSTYFTSIRGHPPPKKPQTTYYGLQGHRVDVLQTELSLLGNPSMAWSHLIVPCYSSRSSSSSFILVFSGYINNLKTSRTMRVGASWHTRAHFLETLQPFHCALIAHVLYGYVTGTTLSASA